MSARAELIAGRWFERRLGKTDRGELHSWTDRLRSDMSVGGMPALHSYGAHFPLVVYVDKGRRRVRRPLLVLNGDRWPGGWGVTTRHQDTVRRLADESGIEQCLIPFSALEAGGVDISTIEIRERRPDETLVDYEPISADVAGLIERVRAGSFGWSEQNGSRSTRGVIRDRDGREVSWSVYTRGYDYTARAFVEYDPPHESGYLSSHHSLEQVHGEWCARIETHRLGDCLFSAETVHEPGRGMGRVRRRAVFVSSFDRNEPAPLYFLAEVPRSAGARTVEQAIDALAPRAVHAAIAQGRAVYRQGDVFAIETSLSDSEIRDRTVSRARLTMWTRGARAKRGETGFVQPLTAAERRRWARRTVKRYHEIRSAQWERALESGPITSGEGNRPTRRRMIADHRARIKAGGTGEYARIPLNRAQRARYQTRDMYRVSYGMNAIQALERATAETALARLRPVDRETVRAAVSIYGTAHAATEVVTARGGATYCRGVLRQVPNLEPGRDAVRDHIPVSLGDGSKWFLAVRNTVPARADGRAVGGPLNGR